MEVKVCYVAILFSRGFSYVCYWLYYAFSVGHEKLVQNYMPIHSEEVENHYIYIYTRDHVCWFVCKLLIMYKYCILYDLLHV